jgi:catechol 2,3-dioxygenase-like lactoylglutathione lyase family enzyme
MIDHLELFTADIRRTSEFYRLALAPIGYSLRVEGKSNGFGADPAKLDFWVREGGPSSPRPHFAFGCATRGLVDQAHRAALEAGGENNGAPALLPHIHPTYYAGFVRDPDGHNVEFVCHARS